jgi:GAF domain-containing protein
MEAGYLNKNMSKEEKERARLAEVHRFLQLGFDKSSEFQDIVDLAAQLCDKPVALITLLDEDVNYVKVRTGFQVERMPRETSFCQYSVQQDDVLVVPDATKDDRFSKNPLVKSEPHIRFYAGAPLTLNNGLKLGTLCLFDAKPNNISELQQKTLTILSRQITFLMELELSHKLLQEHVEEIEAKNESLKKIAFMQSHEIRKPLSTIMGLIGNIKEANYAPDKELLLIVEEEANNLDLQIRAIVNETQ